MQGGTKKEEINEVSHIHLQCNMLIKDLIDFSQLFADSTIFYTITFFTLTLVPLRIALLGALELPSSS